LKNPKTIEVGENNPTLSCISKICIKSNFTIHLELLLLLLLLKKYGVMTHKVMFCLCFSTGPSIMDFENELTKETC